MSSKSYRVQHTVVTTSRQVYKSDGQVDENQTTRQQTTTTKSDDGKQKKKSCCFSCCGIPFGSRTRKSSLQQDISSPPVNQSKRPSVSIVGKRPLSTPTQSKRVPLKDFRESALLLHNQCRQKHTAPKLVLSDKLNKVAQSWAEHLADTRTFGHSNTPTFGENIFFGQRTGAPMTAEDVIYSWYDEGKLYSYSRPNFSSGTGHFTQMVWKNSKELGIGFVQTDDGSTYVVANYDPPGNVAGHFQENVRPLK